MIMFGEGARGGWAGAWGWSWSTLSLYSWKVFVFAGREVGIGWCWEGGDGR
jgi:hypothetical protein